MVIKLDMRQFLHGQPRMLTRDLFVVANLLVFVIGQVAAGAKICDFFVELRQTGVKLRTSRYDL